MTAILEKCIITLSLLAGIPLFFLDKETLGFRRFAWMGASLVGLTVHFFLEPQDVLATDLDKITMACVSVTVVPHFMQLVKDNPLFGLATIPPIILVLNLSVQTSVNNTQEFWRLRAFLHMAAFFLPYLNFLPSGSSTPAPPNEAGHENEPKQMDNETKDIPTRSSKKTKSPGKKGKKKKN